MDGHDTIRQRKRELRSQILARLAAMVPQRQAAASAELRQRLEARPEWKEAASILFYAPIQAEPDIWPLVLTALAMLIVLSEYEPRKMRSKTWRECTMKICEVDSLECPRCGGEMKIISL